MCSISRLKSNTEMFQKLNSFKKMYMKLSLSSNISIVIQLQKLIIIIFSLIMQRTALSTMCLWNTRNLFYVLNKNSKILTKYIIYILFLLLLYIYKQKYFFMLIIITSVSVFLLLYILQMSCLSDAYYKTNQIFFSPPLRV